MKIFKYKNKILAFYYHILKFEISKLSFKFYYFLKLFFLIHYSIFKLHFQKYFNFLINLRFSSKYILIFLVCMHLYTLPAPLFF